jgi:hypothetical protein
MAKRVLYTLSETSYLLFEDSLQLKLNPFCTSTSISVNKSTPFQQRKYSQVITIHGLGAAKQQNAF